jgi:predicted DNA-binding transcriptional regulator YafY
MAADKLNKERYIFLDSCFRNPKQKWSLALLLNYVNNYLESKDKSSISQRTLEADIKHLKDTYDAPIEKYKIGTSNFYKYSDADFSIQNTPINKEDAKKIRKAIDILNQLKGLSIAEDLAATIQKLEHKVEINKELSSTTILFEQNEYYTGNEWFADIYEMVVEQKVLKLKYKPFHKDALTLTVHPYLLKQYNQRWFLIGWCVESNSLGNYPLDRLEEAKVTNLPFILNDSFDVNTFHQNMVGVSLPQNIVVEKIELEFSKQRAPYFTTKPFAPIKEYKTLKNGNLKVTLSLIINNELIASILHYGADVKVKHPLHLQQKIKDIATGITKQ